MKKYSVNYTVSYASGAYREYNWTIEAESFYRAVDKYKAQIARYQSRDSKVETWKFELIRRNRMNIELRFKEWVELRRGLLSKIEEAQNLQEHYTEKLEELPPDCDTKDVKSIRKRLRELEEAEETYSKILTEIEMRKI